MSPFERAEYSIHLPVDISRSDSGLSVDCFDSIAEDDTALGLDLLLSKLSFVTVKEPLIIYKKFQSTAQFGSFLEGFPTNIVSKRVDTIAMIIKKLNDLRLVLHSSPPMSGKSSICALLHAAFLERYPRKSVVRFKCAGLDSKSDFSHFQKKFWEWTRFNWGNVVQELDCLLILDDAHLIYHLAVFFINFRKFGGRSKVVVPAYYL